MDCMTISTFRSLEQQAIRQHRERKANESAYKGMVNFVSEIKHCDSKVSNLNNKTTNKGKINYYA